MFLRGYGYAAEAGDVPAAEERLETVPAPFRGFAYEGAAMAFTVRDRLPFGSSRNLARFLAGRADRHVYMAYVGIGWAMARLPRFRWPAVDGLDPLLRWLILDGYGFHQTYFHTRRYVHEQFQDPKFRWPGESGGSSDGGGGSSTDHSSTGNGARSYANRAIDQGVGRAMWFVGGADPDLVATMIEKFPESRRADLYGGAGLAATYAGGANEAELAAFAHRSGPHRGLVAQGSAFAAEARVRAGLVVPHTEVATRVLCGTSPERAARITQELRPRLRAAGDDAGAVPAYETWRRRIAAEFDGMGGS